VDVANFGPSGTHTYGEIATNPRHLAAEHSTTHEPAPSYTMHHSYVLAHSRVDRGCSIQSGRYVHIHLSRSTVPPFYRFTVPIAGAKTARTTAKVKGRRRGPSHCREGRAI